MREAAASRRALPVAVPGFRIAAANASAFAGSLLQRLERHFDRRSGTGVARKPLRNLLT
jgi:hypothetical protein